jgi:hypothetical protein
MAQTGAYVDLMFAFGHARLGDESGARELLARGAERLNSMAPTIIRVQRGNRVEETHITPGTDPTHQFLLRAYAFRIEQALSGARCSGTLPAELLAHVEMMMHDSRQSENRMISGLPSYRIQRLREQSRILEPEERINPFQHWERGSDELSSTLMELPRIASHEERGRQINGLIELCRQRNKQADWSKLLYTALYLGPSLDRRSRLALLELVEGFCQPSAQMPADTDGPAGAFSRRWLEVAFRFAVRCGELEWIERFVARYGLRLRPETNSEEVGFAFQLLEPCVQVLCSLRWTHHLAMLFDRVIESGHQWESLPTAVQIELRIALAAGWFLLARPDCATELLRPTKEWLADPKSSRGDSSFEYAKVAGSYLLAHRFAPFDLLASAISQLFTQAPHIPDTFTTRTHYSRLHLQVSDAVVLALVTSDFSATPAELRHRLGEAETDARRQALPQMRARVIEWGERDW